MKKHHIFFIIGTSLSIYYTIAYYNIRIESSIVIDRPIEVVWQHFQNTDDYSKWNTLFNIEQFPTHQGQQIKVYFHGDDGKVLTSFQPIITTFDQYHLEWEGKLVIDGLFSGRHQFIFKPINSHSTQFIHREDFNGIFVPWLNYFIIQTTKKRFIHMNYSLKEFIET